MYLINITRCIYITITEEFDSVKQDSAFFLPFFERFEVLSACEMGITLLDHVIHIPPF
jgi:hypothetical protein